jgi:hypothetical protein
MKNCFVCGGEIHDSHPCFQFYEKKKAICMGCENAEIEVWRVSLPGDTGGYYERDFSSMAEGLKHMEEGECFEVHREKMNARKYLLMPEFQGF